MSVKLIECPRDAMQGIKEWIPTELKAQYINQLLKVGFNTIDFGSFVSPKAIPQMKDTAEVLQKLDLTQTHTKLLAIVANKRGASDACYYDEISYLGYPFSISETFQLRNTNATIQESLVRVAEIQDLCLKHKKTLVIYISMAFGNPYGDKWNSEIAIQWVGKLYKETGVKIVALADTIGCSTTENIQYLFNALLPEFPGIEFGAHLHTTPDKWKEKVEAAYESGCRRFDGAIKGYGGCPMAKEELTGNMPTEKMIEFFKTKGEKLNLNEEELKKAIELSAKVFNYS
jgi:hydroxymethylglutaryl-CoA lyase